MTHHRDPRILAILDAHAPKQKPLKPNHHLRRIRGQWNFEIHYNDSTYTRRLPATTEEEARTLRDAILADIKRLDTSEEPAAPTPAPAKKRGRPKKHQPTLPKTARPRKKPTAKTSDEPPPQPNPLNRPCRLFDSPFATLLDAAQELGIKPETLSRMCSQQKYGWSYADEPKQ